MFTWNLCRTARTPTPKPVPKRSLWWRGGDTYVKYQDTNQCLEMAEMGKPEEKKIKQSCHKTLPNQLWDILYVCVHVSFLVGEK